MVKRARPRSAAAPAVLFSRSCSRRRDTDRLSFPGRSSQAPAALRLERASGCLPRPLAARHAAPPIAPFWFVAGARLAPFATLAERACPRACGRRCSTAARRAGACTTPVFGGLRRRRSAPPPRRQRRAPLLRDDTASARRSRRPAPTPALDLTWGLPTPMRRPSADLAGRHGHDVEVSLDHTMGSHGRLLQLRRARRAAACRPISSLVPRRPDVRAPVALGGPRLASHLSVLIGSLALKNPLSPAASASLLRRVRRDLDLATVGGVRQGLFLADARPTAADRRDASGMLTPSSCMASGPSLLKGRCPTARPRPV